MKRLSTHLLYKTTKEYQTFVACTSSDDARVIIDAVQRRNSYSDALMRDLQAQDTLVDFAYLLSRKAQF